MRFAHQTIWITGASSGIGEALAYALAREGANLILSARRSEELERVRLACERPDEHFILALDLEHNESFPDLVSRVLSRVGHIDVLVNNGGVSQRGLACDTPFSVERRLMEIDYFGPVALTKAVLPSMRESRSGRIVVISSLMGYLGTPMRSTYAAAKHALHGYFDSLRAELHDEGIRITLVCPGYVKTSVSINALTSSGHAQGRQDRPQGRGIPVERCAAAIVKAMAKDRTEIVVGGTEILGYYLKRFVPSLATRLVRKLHFGQDEQKRETGSEERE